MKRFLDFLRRDIWRKLIALTIAVVLYLNLYEQKEREIHDVKVEILHDPEIFIDLADQHPSVRLTVKGSKHQVRKLDTLGVSGQVKLVDNAGALRTGRARIRLLPEHFDCGRGVEVVGIDPQVLQLPVQRQISRNIAVEPEVIGRPSRGRVLTAVRCYPDTVTVSGPEKPVASLTTIRTEKLSIEGESIDCSKELKLLNPMPEVLTLGSKTSNVSVEIRESMEIPRKFPDIPVRYLFSPLHANSGNAVALPAPARVAVTITGPQNEINRISRDNVTVFADLSDATRPGEYTVALKATVAEAGDSLRVTTIEPEKVRVTITAPVAGK